MKWVSISIIFFCNFSLMIRREGVASRRKFHTFARFQLDLESSCGAVLRSAHVLSIQHSNIWFGICTINISTVLELLQAWHTAWSRTSRVKNHSSAQHRIWVGLPCWGEFGIRQRPVVTHPERPVARECETRLCWLTCVARRRVASAPAASLIWPNLIWPNSKENGTGNSPKVNETCVCVSSEYILENKHYVKINRVNL